jgi:hypothetical protein
LPQTDYRRLGSAKTSLEHSAAKQSAGLRQTMRANSREDGLTAVESVLATPLMFTGVSDQLKETATDKIAGQTRGAA